MAALELAVGINGGLVNLSGLGADDWAAWQSTDTAGTPSQRKSGGGSTIGSASLVGSGSVTGYTNDPRTIQCNGDGTPTATLSNAHGLYNAVNSSGTTLTGDGYSLTFPADTTMREAMVYLGGYGALGTLVTASLSDSSSPSRSDSTFVSPSAASADGWARITYQAGSSSQTLTVSVVLTSSAAYGNVALQAAAVRAGRFPVAYIGAGTVGTGIAAITPGIPAGVVAGDLLLLFLESANQAFTTPSGFTLSRAGTGVGTAAGTTATRLGIYRKIAVGGDTAPTVADAGDHTLGRILAFRGVDQTTPIAATTASAVNSGTATVSWPALSSSTIRDEAFIVLGCANATDTATPQFTAGPTNSNLSQIAIRTNDNVIDGNGGGIMVATALLTSPGTASGTTGTIATAGQWEAAILTLNPELRSMALGAAAASVVTASGTLTDAVSGPAALAGSPAAVTTVTGALSTAIPLSAAAQAVATLTGGLTTAKPLAAALADVVTVTGALTTVKALASAVSSVVTVSGSLAGNAAALAGDAQAVTTLAGALSTAKPLAGAVSDVVALTGSLSTAIRLAGSPASLVTLAGALTTGKPVAGAVSVVSTLAGALSTSIPLTAAVSGVVTVGADLTGGTTGLQGTAAAQVTVSGALTTAKRLNAALAFVTTASAALTTQKRLNAAVSDAVTVSGTLTNGPAGAALQAAIAGLVTLTASMTGGSVPAGGGGGGMGFEMQGGAHRRRLREVNFKPLLQRVLEARFPRVKPAKERAAKRAKALELEAARLIVDDPFALKAFDALLARWEHEGPIVPSGLDLGDLRALFEAQVGFRLRQLALEAQAKQALAEQRARDEEDSLMALLLT